MLTTKSETGTLMTLSAKEKSMEPVLALQSTLWRPVAASSLAEGNASRREAKMAAGRVLSEEPLSRRTVWPGPE